jgi:hypothetical protein
MDAVKRYYAAVNLNNPQGMLDECDDAIKVIQSHAKCYFRYQEIETEHVLACRGRHRHIHRERERDTQTHALRREQSRICSEMTKARQALAQTEVSCCFAYSHRSRSNSIEIVHCGCACR